MSKLRRTLYSSAACLCLVCTSGAHAGMIVLSGDGNVANALDGSSGIPLDADNQQFFRNVLGTGTSVVVQQTSGAGSPSLNAADTAVNNFYNSLAGVTSTLVAGAISAATLAGQSLFVSVVPDTSFSAGEVSAFGAFLNSGGVMFLLGDNSNFPSNNNAINALITSLGGSMSIIDATVSGATPVANPLTAGVGAIQYVAGSTVVGGTSLFFSGNSTVIAAQTIGTNNNVPEPATLALLGLGMLGLALNRRKHT